MCGPFTHRYTWADIHRPYGLTSPANVQPSYNVCPTDHALTFATRAFGSAISRGTSKGDFTSNRRIVAAFLGA